MPVGVTGVQAGQQSGVGLQGQVLRPAQQHPADPVQRVVLAAAVPEGVLLDPAADVVDRALGQPDGVEGVQHHGRRRQPGPQRPLVAAERVQRGDLHPGAPVRAAFVQPVGDHRPGAAGYHVEQPGRAAAGRPQVHHPGQVLGAAGCGGLEESGLVQPEDGDIGVQPLAVQDLLAVLPHRAHHGAPADPEIGRHPGHVGGVLADPARALDAGPFGQHRPGPDRHRPLRPGPLPTGGLHTAPDPLEPHQHHRSAAHRQVPNPAWLAVMQGGDHPTPRTTGHRLRGLDQQLDLAGVLPGGQHHELGQTQRHRTGVDPLADRGHASKILHHLGPLLFHVFVDYGV
ncbi:MAG: hypothetical protein M3Q39_00700 [Actinomycetota bacterium]|nr:hypothetical protein [Actinomycetota bacterium]